MWSGRFELQLWDPSIDACSEVDVHGFAEGAKINFVTWSPDGRHLAFTIRFDDEDTSSKLCLSRMNTV